MAKKIERPSGRLVSELNFIPQKSAMDKALMMGDLSVSDIARKYVVPNFPDISFSGALMKLQRYRKSNPHLALKKTQRDELRERKESEDFAALAREVLEETIEIRRAAVESNKWEQVPALGTNISDHMEMAARFSGVTEPQQNGFSFSLENVIVVPQAPGVPLVEGEDEDDYEDDVIDVTAG